MHAELQSARLLWLMYTIKSPYEQQTRTMREFLSDVSTYSPLARTHKPMMIIAV